MKNNFFKSKIIKITLAILITFIVVAIVFNIVKRRTSEHIVEDYLLDKYNVDEYKFIKKEHLVEKKRTLDGDDIIRKIAYSYLYYYEFTYRGITTYVYYRDDTDDCFDDYQYEDELNYVYQEFEEYTAYNGFKIEDYLDPRELLYGGSRKLIIGFNEEANTLLNKDVLSKCYEIMNKLKTEFNDQDVKLLLYFSDYMILLEDDSTFMRAGSNHGNLDYDLEFIDHYFEHGKNVEKYDYLTLDEEQLKECVSGKLLSCRGE